MAVSAPPRRAGSAPRIADDTRAVVVSWRRVLAVVLAALGIVAAWAVTTNTYAVLAQQRLADRWEQVVADGAPLTGPAAGDPVARISIPSLGLERVVVEGVDRASLRRAPGHRPGTELPGEAGNSVIQGHRLLWSGPFRGIEGLAFGSPVHVELADGRVVTYLVAGIFHMEPEDPDVAADSAGRPTLTLVTSDPPFRADRLLVVKAVLPPEVDS